MNHNAVFSADGAEVWTSQMEAQGTVLVLDAATLTEKRSIAVGARPAEVTFTGDGKRAFVANGAAASVTVIDTATYGVLATIPVGETPVGAWQASNGIAYVDNEEGKTLSAIDTTTLQVLLTYDLGFTPAMAALAPNGELWVTDTAGRVVVTMARQHMPMAEIPTAPGAHAVAFEGGGKKAYVTNQDAASVSVIDIASKKVIKTIVVGSKPNGAVWRRR